MTNRFSVKVPVSLSDPAEGLVTGWSVISTDGKRLITDSDGDKIPVEVLEAAAHELMLKGGGGRAGDMHERRVGDIVESFVVTSGKRAALGFGDGPEGWVVSLKLHDAEARNLFASGDRPELSFSGLLVRKKDGDANLVERMVVEEISIVDEGASGNEAVRPMIVLAKRAKKGEGMSLEEILAKLSEEEQAVILAALEAAAKPAEPEEPAEEMKAEEPAAEEKPAEEPAPEAKMDEEEKADEEEAEKRSKLVAAEKRAKDAEAKLAAIESERRFEKVAKRVKDDLGFIPGQTEAVAKMLIAAEDGLDAESLATLDGVLRSLNAASKRSSIFESVGTAANSSPSARQEFEAVKKRLVESGMSPGAAHNKALRENNLFDRLAGEESK